uniref:Uncharacterized protein n=1 Tax=Denticeps clupeoides TaxID=299321 RepID=A0AAY4D5S1_9TELE
MSTSVPSSLQEQASGSVMSIYMGDYGNVEVRGTIRFAMNYVEKIGEFHICVVQCKDLAVAEPKRNPVGSYDRCPGSSVWGRCFAQWHLSGTLAGRDSNRQPSD